MTNRAMPRSRWVRNLAITLGVLGLVGCGRGDDSPDALSDDEFCARLIELEEQADDGDELSDAEAIALFRQLADQAPDPQVGSAIDRIGDLVEELSAIDDNDPDAFGKAMGLMFDPRLIAAGDTLDAYLTGTCGLESSSFGDLGIGPDTGDEGDVGDDSGFDFSTSGGAMDDLSAGLLREELADDFAAFAPGTNGTGIGIYGRGRVTVVDAQVFEPDSVDALALCLALAEVVDASTDDPEVVLEVSMDGVVLASREVGGICLEQ